MDIVTNMENIISKEKKELKKNNSYKELKKFYEKMKSEGIAKKNEFMIPPIDTIGIRLQEFIKSNSNDATTNCALTCN